MINLVLLRHGQSMTNAGLHVDNDEQNILTMKGIHDTLRHAGNFRTLFPNLQFDRVFVSPMYRAKQTALNFLTAIENKAIDITVLDDLRERTYGFTSFLKIEDLIKQFGQAEVDSWELDLNATPGVTGESIQMMYDRVIPAYEQHVLPSLGNDQNVLVVSHYYTMKCLQSHIQFGNIKMAPLFEPKNCLPVPYFIN